MVWHCKDCTSGCLVGSWGCNAGKQRKLSGFAVASTHLCASFWFSVWNNQDTRPLARLPKMMLKPWCWPGENAKRFRKYPNFWGFSEFYQIQLISVRFHEIVTFQWPFMRGLQFGRRQSSINEGLEAALLDDLTKMASWKIHHESVGLWLYFSFETAWNWTSSICLWLWKVQWCSLLRFSDFDLLYGSSKKRLTVSLVAVSNSTWKKGSPPKPWISKSTFFSPTNTSDIKVKVRMKWINECIRGCFPLRHAEIYFTWEASPISPRTTTLEDVDPELYRHKVGRKIQVKLEWLVHFPPGTKRGPSRHSKIAVRALW